MTQNLFALPPLPPGQELIEVLLETKTFRVERIISTGQTTPHGEWYDQDHDEWVTVLQGTGVLGYPDGSAETLCPGDAVYLPAHRRHRVVSTSVSPACIWIAVHEQAPPQRT